MKLRIGPIEFRVNAFLVLLLMTLETLRQVAKNDKIMDQLRKAAAESKMKRQQAESAARVTMSDATGKRFTGSTADEIISQMFPNANKQKKTQA